MTMTLSMRLFARIASLEAARDWTTAADDALRLNATSVPVERHDHLGWNWLVLASENSSAKPWRPPFRWNRAPPHHCREKTLSCRKKKRATDLPSVRLKPISPS
jgi:hypothetical protein